MKSFEEIERMVKASRVQASGATDERILGDTEAGSSDPMSREPGPTAVSGPRSRMRGRRIPLRIAVAAVVLLSLLAVLFPGGNAFIPENLLFADVQKAMERQGGVHITGTRRCIFPAEPNRPEEAYLYRTEKRASREGFIDTTYEPNGAPILQVCYHFDSGTVTVIYHFLKQYYRFQVPQIYRDRLCDIGPVGLVEMLFQSGDATHRGLERVQGKEAIGFEVSNVAQRLDESVSPPRVRFFFLNLKESRACLWVDPRTRLPVHMQGEFLLEGCLFSDFSTMRMEETNDRWDWDADARIEEQAFFPEMPEGYRRVGIPGIG